MNNNAFVCPTCGGQVAQNSAFCPYCGQQFGNAAVNTNVMAPVDLNYEIKGGNLPYLILNLRRGEQIICEGGSMSWKSPSVTMETTSNGGVGKVFSRMFSGERLFQNIYTAQEDNSYIAFSSSFPGAIMAVDVKPGQDVICQKSAFLAGTSGVEVSIHFNKKIGVGLFAGEGFIMQRMSGNGKVFIEIDGSMEEKVLQPGERIVISTGHLVMMDSTCQIDIETNKGFKNIFLGGEGIFNTVITGPGKVVLQSMPISKTANILYPYMPYPSSSTDTASTVVNLFTKK